MKLLDMLLHRGHSASFKLPPPAESDPDLVDHALTTARVLSKSDRALDRRRRLNLELERAEGAIRSARASARAAR